MLETIIAGVKGDRSRFGAVIEAVGATLDDKALDAAFTGEAVLLPSEALVGDRMDVVVPEAIHQSREALRKALGQQLLDKWRGQYAANTANRFELSPAAQGARRLRTVALGTIAASGTEHAATLAARQVEQAHNTTQIGRGQVRGRGG